MIKYRNANKLSLPGDLTLEIKKFAQNAKSGEMTNETLTETAKNHKRTC